MKHHVTTQDGKEVADNRIFDVKCFLNFNEDRVEFDFSIDTQKWEQVELVEKRVTYEKLDSATFRKIAKELPITLDESDEASDCTTFSVYAGFKNVLLNLFSIHKKEFKLTLDYTMDAIKCRSIYFVMIPDIKQK